MDDLRQVLESAAADRRRCRVLRLDGAVWPGVVLRIEPVGVVIDVPGHDLRSGEEVRIWLGDDPSARYVEASVIRTGVAAPDRGANAILVGYLAAGLAPAASSDAGWGFDIHLPSGAPISLVQPPVVLLDLTVEHVAFEVPRAFPVRFPDQAGLALRLLTPSGATAAHGRVRQALAGDSRWLYLVGFERVEDPAAFRAAVLALRARAWA